MFKKIASEIAYYAMITMFTVVGLILGAIALNVTA